MIKYTVAAATLALWLAATSASAAITDFVGVWNNTDPGNRGISRVLMRTSGGQFFVHAWGRCHPTDCDWGEVRANLFVPNVGLPVDAGANAVMAQYDHAASSSMLVITTSGDGTLSVRDFNIFKDNSNRSDYDTLSHFARQ